MDPITTAIVAAVAAGVTQGTIADTYNGVKQLIKTKFGNKNDVIDIIEILEKDQCSDGYRLVLQEKIQKYQLEKDIEIVDAAEKLIDQIKKSFGVKKNVMEAKGKFIAQAYHKSKASITINH